MKDAIRTTMKYLILLFVIMSISGCRDLVIEQPQQDEYTPGEYTYTTSSYTLSGSLETGYYLNFAKDYVSSGESFGQVTADVQFESIEDFFNTVTAGELSTSDMGTIHSCFIRDETGILTCDFANLYDLLLPVDLNNSYVTWSGEVYTHNYSSTEADSLFGNVSIYPKHIFEEIFQRDFVDQYNYSNGILTETKSLEGREEIEIYYKTGYAQMKSIQYIIKNGDKTYIVQEDYVLQSSGMGTELVSETVPYRIKMYCSDGSNYYVVRIYHPNSRPTEEWLLSFGLTKYVYDLEVE